VLRAWQGTRLYLDEATALVEQMNAYLLSFANDKFLLFHQGFSDYLHDKKLGKDGMAEVHQAFGQWLSTPPPKPVPCIAYDICLGIYRVEESVVKRVAILNRHNRRLNSGRRY